MSKKQVAKRMLMIVEHVIDNETKLIMPNETKQEVPIRNTYKYALSIHVHISNWFCFNPY